MTVEAAASSVYSSLRVTLLDDDEFNVKLVRTAVTMCGIRNFEVISNARSAMFALKARQAPDIMMINWKEPLAEAISFCKAIRDRESSPAPFLAIVVLSQQATRERVMQARDAGVDEFLAAPFSPKSMQGRIDSILFHRRGFVQVPGFFGPDRRRGAIAEMLGVDRRSDPSELIDPRTGETYIG